MSFLENTSKSTSKSVQYGFRPIYFYSRCAGLWPFTITYHSNGSIKNAQIRIFDCLWFLISICLYLTALISSYDYMKDSEASKEKNFFTNLMFYINQIPPLLFGPVCIVLDMLNRNRLINILNKFTIFDKEVSEFLFSEM